jgi:hypothetical protein
MLAQLPLLLGFAGFFAINLYLWSLPISHESLFVVTAPLRVLFFVAFMWHLLRTTSENDSDGGA